MVPAAVGKSARANLSKYTVW